MARKTGFKLPGFTAYVERITNVTAKEAAELIVEELQNEGPAWTGEFRNNWVIVTGTGKRINATKESSYSDKERFAGEVLEDRKTITAEKLKGRGNNGYTIGNVMTYRDIALDLDPGYLRTTGKRINTAPRDWYVNFAENGQLRRVLEVATLRAEKNPRIKGFFQRGKRSGGSS